MKGGAGGGSAPAAEPSRPVADHPLVVRNAEGSPWWRRQRAPRGLGPPVARLTLPPQPAGWPGPRLTILLPSFRSGGAADPSQPVNTPFSAVLRFALVPLLLRVGLWLCSVILLLYTLGLLQHIWDCQAVFVRVHNAQLGCWHCPGTLLRLCADTKALLHAAAPQKSAQRYCSTLAACGRMYG